MGNYQLGVDIKLSGGSWFDGGSDIIVTDRGDIDAIDDIDNVRQALFRRLNTPTGDLWAHPDYGNAAWDILGDCMDDDFLAKALDAIHDCINAEPRVKLIDVQQEVQQENRIVIYSITYSILDDTREDNLVFTIDLERVMTSV